MPTLRDALLTYTPWGDENNPVADTDTVYKRLAIWESKE